MVLDQSNDRILERLVAACHLLVQGHALLGRVAFTILVDLGIAAADAHHTVLAAHRDLLLLGPHEVRVLLLESDDGHECAEELCDRVRAQALELIE